MSNLREYAKLKPYAHQIVGVKALVRNPFFLLADEMGAGKTKQAIDAAQTLFWMKEIERVLVIAPASVRGVWFDKDLGELKKHLWDIIPARITEFHAKRRTWDSGPPPVDGRRMEWVITNYEFIRSKARLAQLLGFCAPRTLVILDESSAVKNHQAKQTKAVLQLRRASGRVILLNGTPIASSPLDMFAQGAIMHPGILQCKSAQEFKMRHAILGGFQQRDIIGWRNLEDLQKRFAPFVLRRLKRDCLDLPPVMPPVSLTVPLDATTWAHYKQMRDQMVVWLESGEAATASQAGVKALRLAQLTSGFLGGIDGEAEARPVSREKLDFVLDWWKEKLAQEPDLKLLVWCRFVPELRRLMEHVNLPGVVAASIHGAQKPAEREASLRLLDPRTAPRGPVLMGGTYGTGSLGLNFTACHTVVNMSMDFSFWKYLQSMARVDRPGQVHAVSYINIVATGPDGQKTMDHVIAKALAEAEDIATWTTSAWVKALKEE